VIMQSTDLKASSKSRLMSVRTFNALK
jgi:hypothetical protein